MALSKVLDRAMTVSSPFVACLTFVYNDFVGNESQVGQDFGAPIRKQGFYQNKKKTKQRIKNELRAEVKPIVWKKERDFFQPKWVKNVGESQGLFSPKGEVWCSRFGSAGFNNNDAMQWYVLTADGQQLAYSPTYNVSVECLTALSGSVSSVSQLEHRILQEANFARSEFRRLFSLRKESLLRKRSESGPFSRWTKRGGIHRFSPIRVPHFRGTEPGWHKFVSNEALNDFGSVTDFVNPKEIDLPISDRSGTRAYDNSDKSLDWFETNPEACIVDVDKILEESYLFRKYGSWDFAVICGESQGLVSEWLMDPVVSELKPLGARAGQSLSKIDGLVESLTNSVSTVNDLIVNFSESIVKVIPAFVNIIDWIVLLVDALLFMKSSFSVATLVTLVIRALRLTGVAASLINAIPGWISTFSLFPSKEVKEGEIEMQGGVSTVNTWLNFFVGLTGVLVSGVIPSKSVIDHVSSALRVGTGLMSVFRNFDFEAVLIGFVGILPDVIQAWVFRISPDFLLHSLVKQDDLLFVWAADVELLDHNENRLKLAYDTDLQDKVLQLYNQYHTLKKRVVLEKWFNSKDVNFLNESAKRLRLMVDIVEQARGRGDFRAAPFVIALAGDPGIGKSFLVKTLTKALFDSEEYALHERNFLYPRNEACKHWDGYRCQRVVVYDDFAQFRKSASESDCFTELICMASNSPYYLPMAAIDDKGCTFNSPLVVLCTNSPFVVPNSVASPEAIWRRRNKLIMVKVPANVLKNPCVKSSGIDFKKLPEDGFSHFSFSILDPSEPNGLNVDSVSYTFSELVKLLKVEFDDFRSQQAKILAVNGTLIQTRAEDFNRNFSRVKEQLGVASSDSSSMKEIFDAYTRLKLLHPISMVNFSYDQWLSIFVDKDGFYDISLLTTLDDWWFLSEVDKIKQRGVSQVGSESDSLFDSAEEALFFYTASANYAEDRQSLQAMMESRIVAAQKLEDQKVFSCERLRFLESYYDRFKLLIDSINIKPCIRSIVKILSSITVFCSVAYLAFKLCSYLFSSGVDSQSGELMTSKQQVSRPNIVTQSGEIMTARSVALKPNVSTVVTQIGEVGDQNTREVVDKVVLNNFARLVWHTERKYSMNALFVGGRILMIPYHFFLNPETLELHPEGQEFSVFLGDCSKEFYQKFVVQNLFRFTEQRDVAFYVCSVNIPTMPLIYKKHFIREEDLKYSKQFPGILISHVSGRIVLQSMPRVKALTEPFWCSPNNSINCRLFEMHHGWEYVGVTNKGDCGSILVADDKHLLHKIVGFHVAAYVGKRVGVSEVVTREMVDQVFKHVESVKGSSQISGTPFPICVEPELSKALILPEGNFSFAGVMPSKLSARIVDKHDILESPIYEGITKHTTEPSVLSAKDPRIIGVPMSPLLRGINKYGSISPGLDYKLLDEIEDTLSDKLNMADTIFQQQKRVLTEDEAINGIASLEGVEGLKMDSSAGWPYCLRDNKPSGKPGKSFLFKNTGTEMAPHWEVSDQQLRADLDYRLQQAKIGQRVPSVWIDQLKVERRLIAKIQAGKTRVFTMCPVDFAILCKRYFGIFDAHFMLSRLQLPHIVGINPFSYEWTMLFNKLSKVSSVGFCGDYALFDGTIPAEILERIVFIINRFYDDGEENALIRRVLWEEIIHTNQLAINLSYFTHLGNPSGNPLTTIVNSISNMFYSYIVWLVKSRETLARTQEFGTVQSFEKHVAFVVYGDDMQQSVDVRVQHFYNLATFNEVLNPFGIKVTNPDKSEGNSDQLMPNALGTMLKFGYRKVGRVVLPTMELGVVYEMLNWIRECPDHVEALKQNCEASLRFCFFHGSKEFAKLRKALVVVLNQKDLYFELPTFSQFVGEYESRGFPVTITGETQVVAPESLVSLQNSMLKQHFPTVWEEGKYEFPTLGKSPYFS